MSAKTSTRPIRSWAALAQALIATPTRWVVGAPAERRRVHRYANAAAAPRSRRTAQATPLEGVSFFVPNLRFYVLLAAVFGIVLGGLTGGVLGLAFAAQSGETAGPPAAPARPLLRAAPGQILETDGLQLAVLATAATPSAVAGQATVQITLGYARAAAGEVGLWTADGAWSVSAADFGVLVGQGARPLDALHDSHGAAQSWLAAGDPTGWVTLTAQVPCGSPAQLEYDPAPYANAPRLQFALPATVCTVG